VYSLESFSNSGDSLVNWDWMDWAAVAVLPFLMDCDSGWADQAELLGSGWEHVDPSLPQLVRRSKKASAG
jgi:hypothetical protein